MTWLDLHLFSSPEWVEMSVLYFNNEKDPLYKSEACFTFGISVHACFIALEFLICFPSKINDF